MKRDIHGNVKCGKCDRRYYPIEQKGRIFCPWCSYENLTRRQKLFNLAVVVVCALSLISLVYVTTNFNQ